MTTPRILFFADSGPSVGGGHVMRCLTLAGALMEQGAECAFAATSAAAGLLDAFAPAAIERLPLPKASSVHLSATVADRARAWGAHAAVVDHYGFGPGEEAMVRTGVSRLMAVDDLKRGHLCDLVLDSNLDRTAADYPGVESLIGPAFAPVRPAFAALQAQSLARRTRAAAPQRLLVALGLTDVGGITARVVEALLPALGEMAVDIVLGAGAPSLAVLATLASRDPRLTLHVDTPDMAALTAAADIAIGAGGSSIWERCCLGLPSLTLVLADNQRGAASALAARGATEAVGEGDLPDRLAALLADPARLVRMSVAAAALCDGQGAGRAAERLLAVL
jgi:UDP-2,4-diacetamido-2,4,6-trideoxy-beta-L-altropyranose hydrolase